jgi:hypothetical protein
MVWNGMEWKSGRYYREASYDYDRYTCVALSGILLGDDTTVGSSI